MESLKIRKTAAGNWTINGKMYPDFYGADWERRRLNELIQRAKFRKQIQRNYELEKKLKGETLSATKETNCA